MKEQMRKEFDEAFRKRFGFGRMTASANADADQMLKAAEWAWQSSRETIVIMLPDRPYASEADQQQMSDYEIGEGHGGIAEWDKFRDAIHAAGLKTK